MLRLSSACALFACLLAGCSKSESTAPGLAKVSGTVTLDGKPMGGGEVRFNAPGQTAKVLEIKDGKFSGEVCVGKNLVDVVWEKDGKPNEMNKGTFYKVNMVSDYYSGPTTPFVPEIAAGGASDLKFEVKSARK